MLMLTHEPLTGKDTRLVAQTILDAAPVVMHFIRSRVKRRPPDTTADKMHDDGVSDPRPRVYQKAPWLHPLGY